MYFIVYFQKHLRNTCEMRNMISLYPALAARMCCRIMWETLILCSSTNRSQISQIVKFRSHLRIANLRSHLGIASTTCLISSVEVFFGQPLLSSSQMFSHFSLWNLCIHECMLCSGIVLTLYTFCMHSCMANA